MAINTEIYGTSYENDFSGMAKTTTSSLWGFYQSGALELNKMPDASPCYCGMKIDNFFINAKMCNADKSFTDVFVKEALVNSWFMMRNYAKPAGSPYGQSFNSFGSPQNRLIHWDNTTEMIYYYAEYSNHFVFNLKLNKLLFLPYVVCSQTNTYAANTTAIRLDLYVSSEHTNYPYVNGLYMKPFYNRGTDEAPDWSSFGSYDDYFFFTPLAKFTDEFQSNFSNFEFSACIFTTTSGQSDFKNYIPVLGFGANAKRSLSEKPVGLDPDPTHYIYDDNSNPSYIKYCVEYNSTTLKMIYKQLAYFGVFFVGEGTGEFRQLSLLSDRIYCGTIEEDGITYGNYTHGAANASQLSYTWEDTSESAYDPSNPPKIDPNNYGVGMHDNYPWISSPNRLYSINSTNVAAIVGLYNSLWECYYTNNVGTEEGQKAPTEFNYDEFLTISPIDTIISLKLFPYDTSASSTAVSIRLGKYNTGIGAYNADKMKILDFGTVNIFGYFGKSVKGDWRDRETKYTLFAPFCGTLELDPGFYMGKDIGLEYHIDQITGACTAVVKVTADNGVTVYADTISGVCAVDVPITGLDQATIQGQIFNANQQLKMANINAATGLINSALHIGGAALEGDAASAASAAISGISGFIKNNAGVESAQYNLTHTHTIPRQIGAASPLCAMLSDWLPRIIVSQPVDGLSGSKLQDFSASKGFACIIPDKIGTRSGFIQMTNIKITAPQDATIPMTQAEADIIKSLLAGGIYA